MCLLILSFLTAPDAPPQNVTAIPESSTSILVSWTPPPLEDQNGILVSYRLNYSSDEAFAGPDKAFTVNATETTLLVDELEEFVMYSFVVAAETSAGIGPYSDPAVTATTFQDGMCIHNSSEYQKNHESVNIKKPLCLSYFCWDLTHLKITGYTLLASSESSIGD